MKIVYIIPEMSYPGGIGRVTSQKINYLANIGHEVSVITEIQGNAPSFYKLANSIKHYDIGMPKHPNKLKKLFLRKKKIRTLLENLHPDIVVYTYSFGPVKCSFRYKSVLECHFNHDAPLIKAKAYGSSRTKARIQMIYNKLIARRFDIFVVLTKQDKELWRKSGVEKNVVTIPNINSFESNLTANLTEKRVIAVGRLDAQKSFDRLIHIWNIVYNNHKDWKLDIFGKGPDKQMLEHLIKELQLTDSIRINEPTKEVEREYLKSSVLCMTSTYEGLPMVLLEAQACGLPIISYDIPCGPMDIISDNTNGYLIKNGEKDDFAMKLSQLMDNVELRMQMGQQARNMSYSYSINNVMKIWVALFDKLMNN